MKKLLCAVLAVITFITATVIPAGAYSYIYGDEIFQGYDLYDLLGFARPGAVELDLTNKTSLENQGFSRLRGSASTACFAPYKFTLKKKDTITVEGTVSKDFLTKGYYNGVCAFLFDGSDETMYVTPNDLWFERSSKYDGRTFSFSATLPKGTYYLIFATGKSTVGDFDLEITAPNTIESKPKLTCTALGNGKVKLKWTKVKGATKYRVSKLSSTGKYTVIKKSTKKTKYTVSKLVPKNIYKYGVQAYVNGKWTSLSAAEAVSVTAE